MTAEVAIMNRLGVALSADSAATTFTTSGAKIYTANKLFMLSKYFPVGIMVYGNASLLGVPWEVIIKEYRRKLGRRSFSTIEGYGQDFLKYLNGNRRYFPISKQNAYVESAAYRRLLEILKKIDNEVRTVIRRKENVTDSEVREIVKLEIELSFQFARSLPTVNSLPKQLAATVERKFRTALNRMIKNLFDGFQLTVRQKQKLRSIAVSSLVADNFDDDSAPYSGIVLAGYGERQIYPSMREYYVEMVIQNSLKYKPSNNGGDISEANGSGIVPFAQRDMVATFMNGISPDYKQEMIKTLVNLAARFSLQQSNDDVDAATKLMKETGSTLVSDAVTELQQYERAEYVMPVLESVRFLSLDELASMAESLVNLTSFKRRITPVPETVGEPIDVAVISKGDGFIWINRKHYFPRETNPQFLRNYYLYEEDLFRRTNQ
jgi:hypothetical protein